MLYENVKTFDLLYNYYKELHLLLHITEHLTLVNHKTIVGGKRLYHLFFGIIPPGFIKRLYKFRKHNESPMIAMINRLNEKGRGKACLSGTCWANPDDVLIF